MEFGTFLIQNIWGLITAVSVAVANYVVIKSKLSELEERVKKQEKVIDELQKVASLTMQIQKMEEIINELKSKMDRHTEDLNKFYREDWIKVERILIKQELSSRRTKTGESL